MRRYIMIMTLAVTALFMISCTGGQTSTEAAKFSKELIFDTMGGDILESLTLYDNQDLISIELPIPKKEGYTFLGWYSEAECENEFNLYTIFDIGSYFISVNPDVTTTITIKALESEILYAKWEINEYSLTLQDLDQDTSITVTQTYGTEVLELTISERPGYRFDGWYEDEDFSVKFEMNTMPSKNMVLYAKWSILSFDLYINLMEDYDNDYTIPLREGEEVKLLESEEYTTIVITTDERVLVLGHYLDEVCYPFKDITSEFNLRYMETIVSLEIQSGHYLVYTSEGRVFSWGLRYMSGAPTDDRNDNYNDKPKDITEAFSFEEGEKPETIIATGEHSFLLTTEGRLFVWGCGYYGSIGNGIDYQILYSPIEITDNLLLEENERIEKFYANEDKSSVITSNGRILVWGMFFTEMNSVERIANPRDITDLFTLNESEVITEIAFGLKHNLVLTSQNRVLSWGRNDYGQLGDGSNIDYFTPIDITNQFELSDGEYITELYAHTNTSAAISSSGKIFTWGSNDFGILGQNLSYEENGLSPIDITQNFTLEEDETIGLLDIECNSIKVMTNKARYFRIGKSYYNSNYSYKVPQEIPLFTKTVFEEIYSYVYNENIDIVLPTPQREGYTFSGWFSDANLTEVFVPSTMPASDVTVYGEWRINQYDVTLNFNNGEESMTVTQDFGTEIEELSGLVYAGYTFGGWYKDETFTTLFDTNLIPAENTSLYAKWIPNMYSITFDTMGGEPMDSITQAYGTEVENPGPPIRNGYEFTGWWYYVAENTISAFTFDTMPINGVDLFAKWRLVYYTITFNPNGGSFYTSSRTFNFESYDYSIPEPSKQGYTFDGWYSTSDFSGERIDLIPQGSYGDLELYAKWEPIVNDITYTIFYEDYNPNTDSLLFEGEVIISISTSQYNVFVQTSFGRVFSWGRSNGGSGVSEILDTYHVPKPYDITPEISIYDTLLYIRTGGEFGLIRTAQKTYFFGSNYEGQFGDQGFTQLKRDPSQTYITYSLFSPESFADFALGSKHTIAYTTENRVFTFGDNTYGQLGTGDNISSNYTLDITSAFNFHENETVIEVKAGYKHTLLLTSEGRVFVWGDNSSGFLGTNDLDTHNTPCDITGNFGLNEGEIITQIFSESNSSSLGALTSNGRLFLWGRNSYGQLGTNTTTDILMPLDVTGYFSLSETDQIKKVSFGSAFTAIITTEGNLFTAGYNSAGQLGNNTTENSQVFVQINEFFILHDNEILEDVSLTMRSSIVMTSEGRIFTYGSNNYYELGIGTNVHSAVPVEVGFIYAESVTIHSYMTGEIIDEYIPIREGYTFDGWYLDQALTNQYIFGEMPNIDIELYAKWIPNE